MTFLWCTCVFCVTLLLIFWLDWFLGGPVLNLVDFHPPGFLIQFDLLVRFDLLQVWFFSMISNFKTFHFLFSRVFALFCACVWNFRFGCIFAQLQFLFLCLVLLSAFSFYCSFSVISISQFFRDTHNWSRIYTYRLAVFLEVLIVSNELVGFTVWSVPIRFM